MAGWPENPRLIGTRIPRLDGLAKASGKTKYPSDIRPEGTLFGVMLYSPHAHAKVKSIDTSAAEKMPGVKAVLAIAKEGTTLRYQGDDIAAVAAETEEQARDAARAIKVEYEVLPHAVTEAQAMAEGAPEIVKGGNVRKGRATAKGKPDEAMAEADATIEATYSLPVITHVCLEPHGLTAKWDGDGQDHRLGEHAGRQRRPPRELAGKFEIPASNVTVLTEVMGGGFGSKFGADIWGLTAAELSKKAGKPVRMFLDRVQEHLAGGQSPERDRPRQARGDQGRQDRRHGRRDARDRRQPRRLAVPAAVRLRRPGRLAEPLRRLRQRRRRPRHAGARPSRRAAPSWKRPWTTWPTSWGSTRSSSGSRTSPRTTSARRSTRPRSRSGPS